jgi:hypothetical protein
MKFTLWNFHFDPFCINLFRHGGMDDSSWNIKEMAYSGVELLIFYSVNMHTTHIAYHLIRTRMQVHTVLS